MSKNRSGFQLLSHNQWADRIEMQQEFVAASDQRKMVEWLRAAIRDDNQGSIHVRVIGEPGIGKTRLILETLRADYLKSLVLYAR
jgi:Ni2+-binding GTPase involved in maturation of urease and hydrogenase